MDKRKLPKHWKFDGKPYQIVWKKPRNAEGLCDSPKNSPEDRKIHINPNLDAQDLFETCLHEATHGMLFLLDEDTVTEFARNMTDFLFKCFKIEKID